jgi:hypothetical protein
MNNKTDFLEVEPKGSTSLIQNTTLCTILSYSKESIQLGNLHKSLVTQNIMGVFSLNTVCYLCKNIHIYDALEAGWLAGCLSVHPSVCFQVSKRGYLSVGHAR